MSKNCLRARMRENTHTKRFQEQESENRKGLVNYGSPGWPRMCVCEYLEKEIKGYTQQQMKCEKCNMPLCFNKEKTVLKHFILNYLKHPYFVKNSFFSCFLFCNIIRFLM